MTLRFSYTNQVAFSGNQGECTLATLTQQFLLDWYPCVLNASPLRVTPKLISERAKPWYFSFGGELCQMFRPSRQTYLLK